MFGRTTKPVEPKFKSEIQQRKTLVYNKTLSLEQEAQIYKATGKLPKYELDVEEPKPVPAPQPVPQPLEIKQEVKAEPEKAAAVLPPKKKGGKKGKINEPYYGWTLKGIEVATRRIIELAAKREGHKIGAWCNLKLKEAADHVLTGETMPVSKKELIDEVKEEIEQLKAEIPRIVKKALHESIKNRTITQKRKSLLQRIFNG